MPADKKKSFFPILAPVGKAVDKLLRKEKKVLSAFREEKAAKWPFGLNLGSLFEVYRRAETARQIARRAIKRRRRPLSEPG
ncbi:MAG: hypothetical protein HQL91_12985 [Magnetococcales bacterium]|nr:hypothetical protein [Magnetococcales bacterium]